jgi:hypothetical protein
VAFEDLLVHRLTSYRRSPLTDRFGQPAHPEPSIDDPVLDGVPCFLSRPRGGERFTDRSRDVVEELHVVFLAPGWDLVEEDEVIVKDQDGNVLLPLTNVVHIRRMTAPMTGGGATHHLEVELHTVRGSES